MHPLGMFRYYSTIYGYMSPPVSLDVINSFITLYGPEPGEFIIYDGS